MPDITTKILKIVASELIEAIIFIALLLVASALPEDNIRKQIITLIVSLWAITGISTPIVIWLEFEKEVAGILKNMINR